MRASKSLTHPFNSKYRDYQLGAGESRAFNKIHVAAFAGRLINSAALCIGEGGSVNVEGSNENIFVTFRWIIHSGQDAF